METTSAITELQKDADVGSVAEKGREFFAAIEEWVKTYPWTPIEIGLLIAVGVLAIAIIYILVRRSSMRSDFREMKAAYNEMTNQVSLWQTFLKEFGIAIDGVGKELEPETAIAIREAVKDKAVKIVEKLIGKKGPAREKLDEVVDPIVDRAIEGLPGSKAFEAEVAAKVQETGVDRASFIISQQNKDGRTRKLFLTTVDDATDEIIPVAVGDQRFTDEVTAVTLEEAIKRGCWLVSSDNNGGQGTTRYKLEVAVNSKTINEFLPAAVQDPRFTLAVGDETVQQVIQHGTEALKARESVIGKEVASQVGGEVNHRTMQAIGAIKTLSGMLSGNGHEQ